MASWHARRPARAPVRDSGVAADLAELLNVAAIDEAVLASRDPVRDLSGWSCPPASCASEPADTTAGPTRVRPDRRDQ